MIDPRDYSEAYEDSAALRRSLFLVSILCPTFALIFVALRFYTARAIIRGIYKDDWLILVAMVFSIGYSIAAQFHLKYGLGLHKFEITDKSVFKMYRLMSTFPIAMTYNFVTLFTKASILVFYLRFSTSKRFNITVYSVLSLTVGYCLMSAFAVLYSCSPIQKNWNMMLEGTCINPNPWYGTIVSINVLTDLIILLLPIWLLRPLQVGCVQKTAVAAILGTGGFVVGVSIFRLYVTVDTFTNNDFYHRYGVNYLWLGIEINVAIICACLPCLRALAGRFLPSLMSTHRSVHRGLDTIPVTERSRHTRSSGMAREHFEIIVDKAEGPSTMWLESRPSSGYMWAGKSALDLSDYGSEYDRESIGELQKPQQTWRPSQFRDGYI